MLSSLPTLERFLSERRSGRVHPMNSYVRHPGFQELYVRISDRILGGVLRRGVLDIARVEVRRKGRGVFSRFAQDLHDRGYTMYIESVLNRRFAGKLLDMGFTPVPDLMDTRSFYLLAGERLLLEEMSSP